MDEQSIEEAVLRFRMAMERCHSRLGTPFDSFPRGCCGDTAELLAAYLKDEGLGVFEYVSGWCTRIHSSHAWLEKDDLVIDATSDQFFDKSRPAMVTGDRAFYTQFSENVQRRADGDFRLVDGTDHLASVYTVLRQHIG